ncbi:hypothetical protein EDD22DRAFT_961959 [Suillus occidentalis]|nr:hypothetical protein EDD22DRAFT_961959 [Suillus occidentalis]
MNFDFASSSSNELQAEAPCKSLFTPPPRPFYLHTAGTPSQHSSSPSSSPSLVSATGSATDDDTFPLTPNSKGSLCEPNSLFNGIEPQARYSPPSEYCNPPICTTQFEDQCLFDRLQGRPLEVNDSSDTINDVVKDMYLKILGNLSTNSFVCAIQYLEAVCECHCMSYHAAGWEISEYERRKALARSMCEDSRNNFMKADHPTAGSYSPVAVRNNNKTAVHRTDAVLAVLNGAKEMRLVNWYVLL